MVTQAGTTDRQTVLYIEGDEKKRGLVRESLETHGFRVLTAQDGLLGIDAARRYQPDLVLIDINLPNLSGEAVTTRLKGMPGTSQIPIVAIGGPSSHDRALVAGCSGFIAEPLEVDHLAGTVGEYLQGRRDALSRPAERRVQIEYSQSLVARLEAKVRQLEDANHQLKRIDKLKGDFIELTSHEIRTPLTLVQGYADLLRETVAEQLGEEGESIELADGLVRSVERLRQVISEILSVSRIASGQMQPAFNLVLLKEIVDEAAADIGDACRQRQITLVVDDGDWPAPFHADGDMLKLALDNLLTNALKYTPDGGTITVEGELFQDSVDVIVADTGIGIDPDDQHLVFEEFYTAGDVQLHSTSKSNFKGGGLGLGLAIAWGVVDAHDGRIWVESSGRDEENFPGSRFHLLIPLREVPTVQQDG